MQERTTTPGFLPYLVLFIGVAAAASAAILIRLAQDAGMPSTTIAAGRLGFAALILLPIAWARAGHELRRLRRRDVVLGCAAGMLLAVHMAAWIASLELTSVASSVALVTTNPIWIGLASFLLFRERLGPLTLVGIGLTISGSVTIALSDSSGTAGSHALLGDALALLGALMVSGYFLIGRDLRRRVSVLAYIWLVYTSAAVFLVLLELGSVVTQGAPLRSLLEHPPEAYALLLGLALGPQLLGHTAFNWALRYLSATFVAIAILGEPIGSALLAYQFFDERFEPWQLVGFVLLLTGIALAALAERKRGTTPVPVEAPPPAPAGERVV